MASRGGRWSRRKMNYLIIWLSVVLIHSSLAEEAGECVQKSPCSCSRADGSTLDLSPLVTENHFFEITYSYGKTDDINYSYITYYFHPCKDALLPKDDAIVNACKITSLCERFVLINKTNSIQDNGYLPIAVTNNVSFKKGIGSSIALYYDVKPRTVMINLLCSTGDTNDLTIISPDQKNTILAFYSKHACFSPPTDHHSLGTTLLIILFVMILAYLLLGCCVKRFLMGARGVEIIPNLNFWKELPSLVKDGATFVQNGFKPPSQSSTSPGQNPNPNTYDSI